MFNFIFYSKKNLALLIFLILLILILFFVQIFSGPSQPEPSAKPIPVFSPSPRSRQLIPQTTPFPSEIAEATSSYAPEKLKLDYERIIARQPLSPSDQTAKDSLLELLNNQSGILQKTDTYQIEYVKAPDSFMVELNSIDPEGTKLEVGSWFRQQGLSDQGICNLPVVFYLSQGAKDYLSRIGSSFNPIPEGCE